jgi:DNA recombination protein Rad52
MSLSQEQKDLLSAPLSREVVKSRDQGRGKVSYVESWHVIAEANRIFGFDGWSSETIETTCVVEKDRLVGKQLDPGWAVTYNAKVRVTIPGAPLVWRDGVGTGHGIDRDLGQAHESAIKEAESDAQKRALRMFGNQFGLALYDKSQANVADESELTRLRYIETCNAKIDAFDATKDDPKPLLIWWNNEHKARDDLLNVADRIEMKNRLTAKLPTRTT